MILTPTSDAAAMSRVHGQAFDAPWTAKAIAELLAAPGVFAIAVDAVAALAGFILCRAAAGEAEILTLAVPPEHRRRGVASALLEAGAVTAHGLGARTLFLEVAADNEAALRLYATSDFKPAGRRSSYYARAGGGVDALVLRRDLNRAVSEPYD